MERDFEPDDTSFDLSGQPTDEDEALKALDDTSFRPLPELSAVWEPLKPAPADTMPTQGRPEPGRFAKLRLYALVAGVAVVSFVAGGLTARLSSQMPVLFADKPRATEVTASFQEPAEPTDTQEEPVEETDAETDEKLTIEPIVPSPPSIDTTVDAPEVTVDAPEVTDDYSDEPTHRWDFDSEGDRSISYDSDRNNVTFDYDGYTFDFTLDDLLNDKSDVRGQDTWGQDDSSRDTEKERYNSWDTGDDATDVERDLWNWRGLSENNYDYHT